MKMRAYITYRYGPPEVQVLSEIDRPKPGPRDILIKVHATTVNRTDTGFRSAEYVMSRLFTGLRKPKIKVFGTEFAGEVQEIGSEVTAFSVGDRVFGFNDAVFGAHAEYMVVPEKSSVIHIPDGLSYTEAAPLAEGAHYALNNLRAARVKPGDSVLIYGATGAIGSAAVQIAKAMGTQVTALCTSGNEALVHALGADVVLTREKTELDDIDERFDFIFDAVGKSSFGACRKLLKPTGCYCSTELGKRGENVYLALWYAITKRRAVIFPIPPSTKEQLEFLRELVIAKQYKPVIDRVYRFEDLVEATRYVQTGQKIGNVVIRVVEG
jgi:NADPH:quinone reductase-like Zn-dependent oxidoreductase